MTRIAIGVYQHCLASLPHDGTVKQQFRFCGTASAIRKPCYGATYAAILRTPVDAIPHLLKIAEPNRGSAAGDWVFLGFVTLCARDRHRQSRGR
jgi:hypothetical protein